MKKLHPINSVGKLAAALAFSIAIKANAGFPVTGEYVGSVLAQVEDAHGPPTAASQHVKAIISGNTFSFAGLPKFNGFSPDRAEYEGQLDGQGGATISDDKGHSYIPATERHGAGWVTLKVAKVDASTNAQVVLTFRVHFVRGLAH